MDDAYLEERDKEEARLHAYKHVFESPDGQIVLKDLQQRYLFRMISKDHATVNNGAGLAYIAGQRELLIFVMETMNADIEDSLEKTYPLQPEDTNGPDTAPRPVIDPSNW